MSTETLVLRPTSIVAYLRAMDENKLAIFDDAIFRMAADRITVLEHALRRASEKFSWLAEHHISMPFPKNACREFSHEFWNIQAGITS